MISNKILTSILLSASILVLSACNNKKNADSPDNETTLTATAALDAVQETAEVNSEGAGSFEGTLDTATGEFTFKLEWSGLTGPPSMMHFHGPADPGADAGVKIGITDFPAEAAGSVSQTVTVEEADRADLLAGKWYVNIHTDAYGAGEIRGQVEFTNSGGAAQ
ncbi:CHRD domain-containing protein [Anseongella ginsenosidimutans]|uniref:CHRD domain-containing protein n=1 Tax=Anseongella ginsenosidimutans TaxID=496056 RepID=A0A4R3KW73_9SPHI|nr:CHRD domain-containing protein [Anseongella ginsenosidimutans]QEC51849.1 CHRD domain-containing protein [Anseongella ginsenosidimutans]TCS89224.1 CHRD domain-containing protein [Anseongella ginsenosidimutans]